MTQKLVTESPEKTQQHVESRETSPASAQSFQGGLHPVAQLQRTLGNRNVAKLIQTKQLTPGGKIIGLQRKLTVGPADDQYEQEADQVARQVMNTSDAVAAASAQRAPLLAGTQDPALQTKPLTSSITPVVQRQRGKESEGEEDKDKEEEKDEFLQAKSFSESAALPLQRQIATEDEEAEPVQAKSASALSGTFEAGADVETQVSLSKGRGSPLPDPVRAYMEPRFGVDFSHVHVHTGSDALQMNQAVGAQAFTHGSDIYFGEGRSPNNLELTAHELTHVVQQTGGTPLQTKKLDEASSANTYPSIQRTNAVHGVGKEEVSGSDPISTEGYHLFPYKVAHTVHQHGKGSSLHYAAERGTDAMETSAPAQIGGLSQILARKTEIDTLGDQGEKEMMAGPAKQDIVMKVSNATDVADASKALALLEDNQVMVEKAAAMINSRQRSSGDTLQNIAQGKDNKLLTQVPLEAIAQNAAVISDLKLYLIEAGGQNVITSGFQDQYSMLTARYGRLEGIAKNYAGMSLKDMKPGEAGSLVDNAIGAGGNKASDLATLFQELMQKDPAVRGAREKVESSTQELEKMPSRVSDDMLTAVTAMQTFEGAINTATVAEGGVNSLGLRNAFQAAKAKGEEAKKLTGTAKELVITGGKAAAETAAKELAAGMVATGGLTLSRWGALAAGGAASGGTAVAMAAADKFVIEPAKKMLEQALINANAACGSIDAAAQLDADIDAEQAKQDSATIETHKHAKATLANAAETALQTMTTWVKTAMECELKKTDVKKSFTALENAIMAAASSRGKGQQGKALAEMAGFLQEAEQFIVQANVVLDIATKGLQTKDSKSIPAKARVAMDKIKSRMVWMVHTFPFKMHTGETVTHYGAQEVNMKIIGPGLAPTADEVAGEGRADGFKFDGNNKSSNEAIPGVIPNIESMRAKVLAVRAQIAAQVFGSNGK